MKRSLLLYLILLALTSGAIRVYWKWSTGNSRIGKPPASGIEALRSDTRPIRVNLTSRPRRKFELAVDSGYTLRTVDGSRVLDRAERLEPTTIAATPDGFRIGETEYDAKALELVPDSSPSIWVGSGRYRGKIRFLPTANNRVIAINLVPLDQYLASVIDSEMPLDFGTAARQAQAIVARTYALYQMQRVPAAADFDVYATTRSQKYLGHQYRDKRDRRLAGESDDSRKIVRDTAGVVCTHAGQLFCTYYCAVCGGQTTQGDSVFSDAVPLMRSVECNWCSPAPLCDWQTQLDKSDVSKHLRSLLNSRGKPFGTLVSIRSDSQSLGGTEMVFSISDGKHRYRLTARELRAQLKGVKLHSPRFSIREHKGTLVFAGRGHGHGVGLCQWGARGMGRAGHTATEILEHYYPGVRLMQLPMERSVDVSSLVIRPDTE